MKKRGRGKGRREIVIIGDLYNCVLKTNSNIVKISKSQKKKRKQNRKKKHSRENIRSIYNRITRASHLQTK